MPPTSTAPCGPRAALSKVPGAPSPPPSAAALGGYFEFYAGAADKLHGETLPYQAGYTVLTVREPPLSFDPEVGPE